MTVLKRLADLETPREERERRIREKLEQRSGRLTPDEDKARKQRDRERRRWEGKAWHTVTWLDPPVPLSPHSRTLVVGICSDCDPAVAREYGVRLR